jgi:ribosomal protein S21
MEPETMVREVEAALKILKKKVLQMKSLKQ